MPSPRGKRVAVLVAMGAVLALGAGAYAFRSRIQEEYWLWRLESKDDDVQNIAIERLVALRSPKAALRFGTLIGKDEHAIFLVPEVRKGRTCRASERVSPTDKWTMALVDMGEAGVAELSRALRDKDGSVRILAGQGLSALGPVATHAVPVLQEVLSKPKPPEGDYIIQGDWWSEENRPYWERAAWTCAADALRAIQGDPP